MQTRLLPQYRESDLGREAEAILRACVHCGFCTATCPTYQLLGDERDGPRGRIYLVKQLLEGGPVSRVTQRHLDRCLTCRSCETTCPSDVRYGRLVEIGRLLAEERVRRPFRERVQRWLLRRVLPHPRRMGLLLGAAGVAAPLLPRRAREKLPPPQPTGPRPEPRHPRRVLALEGCVQSVATPATNAAAAKVLDRLGIGLVSPPGQGCCGAVSHHLSAEGEALAFMRRNIDAWWPAVEAGAEAILISASGCGVMVKEYGERLAGDPEYAEKAARVSGLAKDLAEVLAPEPLESLEVRPPREPLAFHPPCTLQHGQKLAGVVEGVLERLGFRLVPVADSHLCCGSAGTYSILQPELSRRLLQERLSALQAPRPAIIATANVGCQLHLRSGAEVPVKHWIELVAEALAPSSTADP